MSRKAAATPWRDTTSCYAAPAARAGDLGVCGESPLGELGEAGPLLVARAERLLALVARLVGGVLGDGEHLAGDLVVARRVVEQLLDPAFGLEIAVDEPASEQDPDADVRERAKREQPVRRVDQLADLRMLFLNAVDDRADRTVHERDPGLFRLAHHCEG